ncbi:hypothetical protein CPB83DRAFT_836353 [Crepidotus variabilis]|uniref:Uncharacterized protein n=1 Tax=Crepidotus variabilis TaxID=179855 RepID=A0A9P6EFF7_9AGAR|nr:hypothetical protein CPB83DRAFT_836353 [Crepidotus variabilis]
MINTGIDMLQGITVFSINTTDEGKISILLPSVLPTGPKENVEDDTNTGALVHIPASGGHGEITSLLAESSSDCQSPRAQFPWIPETFGCVTPSVESSPSLRLAGESAKNDVYVLGMSGGSANLATPTTATARLFLTTGNKPSLRMGHATALMGVVMAVWGGDTNTNTDSDRTLDLHGSVMNRQVRNAPAQKTGHVFGDTDGKYHYNDTWLFDLRPEYGRSCGVLGLYLVREKDMQRRLLGMCFMSLEVE